MLPATSALRCWLTTPCLVLGAALCQPSVLAAPPASCMRCADESCPQCAAPAVERPPSWVFSRSTYSHAPETGARVAQYQRRPAVEELPDPRLVTSGYRRTRTDLRGADGSIDSNYQVQSWGNGRGGLDAEWERFHDAWRQSFLSGGYYNGPGFAPGFGHQPGFGYGPSPGFGYGPGPGFGPGAGYGYGRPVYPHGVPQQPPHSGGGPHQP